MADTLSTATTERLTELLTPVVEQAGLFLEGVETTRAGRYSTVRVIVDRPDGPGDLDLDTVAEVTQTVSDWTRLIRSRASTPWRSPVPGPSAS